MTDGQRRGFQIGGIVCLVLGLPLMFGGPLIGFMSSASSMSEPSGFFSGFIGGAVAMFVGFLFVAAGLFMAKFGFMKAYTEVAATETAGAVEHASAAGGRGLGRGLRESGAMDSLSGRTIVKVRCDCGYLETEDAKFCSDCGNPM